MNLSAVKPEPPLNLHLEMTEGGEVKMCWSDPALLPYPLQYQVRISARPGHSAWQMVQVALEASLAIDNTLLDSSSLVQVRCRNHQGLGFWSDWSTPYDLSLGAEVLYFPPQILTSAGSNVSFHCIYKNKSKIVEPQEVVWWLNLAEEIPASLYTLVSDRESIAQNTIPGKNSEYMQLEKSSFRNLDFFPAGTPKSRRTGMWCGANTLLFAKYKPDYEISGTITLIFIHLHKYCSWSQIYCSDFPSPSPESEVKECHLQKNHSYECTFQPIFLLSGYTLWIEFKHFLGTLESSPACVIPADVVKPLPPSNIRAELTRNVGLLNVSWTNPVFTNSDLKFQIRYAVNREEIPWELCEVSNTPSSSAVIEVEQLCVEYVVQVRCRELDGAGYWSDWSGSAQTLVQDIRVDAVRSLSAYPVNSTCVVVVWTLSPQIDVITSFVIEWKNLNKEEETKWVRVPPNMSKYYIYDYFILIEKYQFSLYPVFPGGVGRARATDQFSKGGFENENNGSLSVVLPIVLSTSVLLLGVLLVSHQRMKKLLWEDVPNPKNCSWAQGVNFQQPETFEHLFTKHPEATSFEPLLDAEIVLEDISVTKALEKEGTQDFLGIASAFPNAQDSERDSACSSSHFNSSSSSQSSQEEQGSGGIDLKYATVIVNSRSDGLCERKMSPSSCCDRCFLAEDSAVSGAFSGSTWEVGSGVFLVFPGSPGRQPSKTLSLISSEGFSEPSDHDDAFTDSPERSLCYLGITPLEKRENDIFLTESSGMLCQFHARDVLTDTGDLLHTPMDVRGFVQSSLKPKALVPYVPQFGMAAATGNEATEKNSAVITP
ncbi:hypothetical protein BTVI_88743 [Pitangus sulphuratus]|nr:hypothetical protein BTVI_88743 [Pitangus sulphuratus]